MNLVILQGNIANQETKYTQGGKCVVTFSVATHEKYKDQEKTLWHNVVVFGKSADGLSKIIDRAKTVLVRGKIQTRSYEDKQGKTRYVTEIIAEIYGGVTIVGWKEDKRTQQVTKDYVEKSRDDIKLELESARYDHSDIPF